MPSRSKRLKIDLSGPADFDESMEINARGYSKLRICFGRDFLFVELDGKRVSGSSAWPREVRVKGLTFSHPLEKAPSEGSQQNVFQDLTTYLSSRGANSDRKSEESDQNVLGQIQTFRFIGKARKAFLNHLDPDYVGIAKQFEHSRLEIYYLLARFDHSRLRDLARSAPAAFSALACINHEWGEHTVEPIVKQIIMGDRLRSVLSSLFQIVWSRGNTFAKWRLGSRLEPSIREALCARWIWLRIYGSYNADPKFALRPPPIHIPKDHLKCEGKEFDAKTNLLQSFSAFCSPKNIILSERRLRDLTHFIVSNSSSDFMSGIHDGGGNLIRFLEETNLHPSSKTNVKKFSAAFADWKSSKGWTKLLGQRSLTARLHKNRIRMQSGSIEVRSIDRPIDYIRTGRLMANCLAHAAPSYIPSLTAGGVVHLAVRYSEELYAFELLVAAKPPILVQARGIANARIPTERFFEIQKLLETNPLFSGMAVVDLDILQQLDPPAPRTRGPQVRWERVQVSRFVSRLLSSVFIGEPENQKGTT